MKHTELPWKRVNNFIVPVSAEKDKTDYGYQSGRYIATCHDTLHNTVSFNTEFIVRACNNHYPLIDALKELEKWAHNWTDKDNGLLVKVRNILKQAE